MRIAVLGGTFDPVHLGHLAAASEVCFRLGLDQVLFSPTGQSWHKDTAQTAPAADRLAMLELATAADDRFRVTTVDIDRGGPTYTVDTLADLRAQRAASAPGGADEWFFITGADALAQLHSWREPERIASLATIVAITRPGHDLRPPMVAGIETTVVDVPGLDISSSDIRARVAAGAPIAYLVPDTVADYISEHALYLARAT